VICAPTGAAATLLAAGAVQLTLRKAAEPSLAVYSLAFLLSVGVFWAARVAAALIPRSGTTVRQAAQNDGHPWFGAAPLLLMASPALKVPLWLVGVCYGGYMLALWQAQMVASIRRQLAGLEHLSKRQLLTSDEGEILREFCRLLRELFGPQRVRVWGAEEGGQRLRVVAGDTAPHQTMQFGEGLIGRAAQRSRPYITQNAAQDSRAAEGEKVRAGLVAFPIEVHGRVLGVVEMQMAATTGFGGGQVGQLESLCGHLAVILENIRLHRGLHEAATTDGLTGLLNHRRFQQAVREELQRAFRYRHAVSLLMIDVDDFKQYNDKFGHPSGDGLLREIAEAVQESIRTVDVAARYGGEEFAVLLPETGQENAEAIAERVRSLVARKPFEVGEEEPLLIRQTVSIGLATYPDHATDAAGLVQLADKALYLAKRTGKNKVVSASEVIGRESEPAEA
jgi:diguanylate cyclase (GGDEF)-like protein